jgi:hypothetical protein
MLIYLEILFHPTNTLESVLILIWKLKIVMRSFTRGRRTTQYTLTSILRPLFLIISSSSFWLMSLANKKWSGFTFLENVPHPSNLYNNFGKFLMVERRLIDYACGWFLLPWSYSEFLRVVASWGLNSRW